MEKIVEKYEQLCNKYQAIEEEAGEKAIHDKRVALRRVFSILALYKISPSKVKNGKDAFKMFGELRDVQVQISKLENDYDKSELHEYIEHLKELEIKLTEKTAMFCHKKHVIFPEIKKKDMILAEVIEEVEKRLKSVVKKTELLKKNDAASIHKVRIEFKKFRYTLEILAHVENIYEAKIESLKKYQDLLGDIQDSEVLLKGLTTFYGKGKAGKLENIKMIERNQALNVETFINEKNKFIEVCEEAIRY